jgi:hypothetical protein
MRANENIGIVIFSIGHFPAFKPIGIIARNTTILRFLSQSFLAKKQA